VSGSASVVLCATLRGIEFEVGPMCLVSLIDFANSHRFASTSAKVSSIGFTGSAKVISPCVEAGGVSFERGGDETGRSGSDVRDCGGELGVTAG